MSRFEEPSQPRLFFIIGPLRTGSSLMARCIDDHRSAICLCESEINRALYGDYFVYLHGLRMASHGLPQEEVLALLDRKKQDCFESLISWYHEALPRVMYLYGKPDVICLGDKSPDFYRSQDLVSRLANDYRLIYTVRDPRAILGSIQSQADSTPEDRVDRWDQLLGNYIAWKPYLNAENILVVRFEDLIHHPERTMRQSMRTWTCPSRRGFSNRFREHSPVVSSGQRPLTSRMEQPESLTPAAFLPARYTYC